tara:strand:+ start:5 stop:1060 length:1056 start_codon:yes stop_codon:yes gene_type:complete
MKILIIRNDRIGDLISSSLIIPKLRHAFGNKISKIDLICSNYGFIYASALTKELSNIYINERALSPSKDFKLLKIIRNNKYDLCITLSPNNKSFLLNILSKSKLKASIRIQKRNLESKPISFLAQYFDIFMNIKNGKDYGHLTWSDFYSRLCKDIYKTISKKKLNKKIIFPSIYLKPKISYTLNKSKISNYVIFHIDEKWELSNVKIDFLSDIILKISINKKVLVTSNYLKTKLNDELNTKLGFKHDNKSLVKSSISKNLYLLNKTNKDNKIKFLKKLIQCISLSKCVIQVHGGIGHYAGSFSRNIINLKVKNENLQKLYKIHTKGSYLDLYINNSQKFKNSIMKFLNKIN